MTDLFKPVERELTPAEIENITELGHQHRVWCRNFDGIRDSDGCVCADEQLLVLHVSEGGDAVVPAEDPFRRPIRIGLKISEVMYRGDPAPQMRAGIDVPGGLAEISRSQLRMLIAELQHIDLLWDM